jgi:glycosyltransferase involved in cell wall biosynthesis
LKISSVIIAKNEEKNIFRCIQGQLECIDEIIVLIDNLTTDKTPEIVKSFPTVKCKLIEWQGYSKTKRYGASLALNNWIFWIDADEAVTEELSEELKKFKNSKPEFYAYSVRRKAFFLGKWIKHSGWFPARVIRLFDKNFVDFSEDEVHEHIVMKGKPGTQLIPGELKGILEHYTDPDINHYFLKFNNYTTLAAEDLAKKGKKFRTADLLIRPPWLFIKMYIIKLGFLDGIEGLILAIFSSAYVFIKYCKLWERDQDWSGLKD